MDNAQSYFHFGLIPRLPKLFVPRKYKSVEGAIVLFMWGKVPYLVQYSQEVLGESTNSCHQRLAEHHVPTQLDL